MKRGKIEHWSDITKCNNLLLFSELVEELLFDYSIPSNRISTLNSHYLCIDALSTISTIENNGVPEGTLKPIAEELYRSLENDIVFKLNGENPIRFFVKSQNGKYSYAKINELCYEDLKKIILSLFEKYFQNEWYINIHKENIKRIIINNKTEEWQDLFKLTKSFLTELVNGGYNSRFIYEKLHYYFYSKNNTITSPSIINEFLNNFSFKSCKFTVILKMRSSHSKYLDIFGGFKVTDTFQAKGKSLKEKSFITKTDKEKYVYVSVDSLDYYSACDIAKDMIVDNIAFYKLYDHNCTFKIDNTNCGVYDEKNKFVVISDSKNSVHKIGTLSQSKTIEQVKKLRKALAQLLEKEHFSEIRSLIHAAEFHALSIDSNSKENQLLDMWSIFENLLDISNEHTSDRIQQICTYLVPILKRKYIFSLYNQLAQDIMNYSPEIYKEMTESDKINCEAIHKLFAFTVLEEYNTMRTEFYKKCKDFPLLIERVSYYSSTLNTTKKIYRFVEKHSERVRWQVMRIYRNRNLIIHNSESMPYLGLLIENLHAYVDDFLDYTIDSLSKQHGITSMCQELFTHECEWLNTFGKKDENLNESYLADILQN